MSSDHGLAGRRIAFSSSPFLILSSRSPMKNTLPGLCAHPRLRVHPTVPTHAARFPGQRLSTSFFVCHSTPPPAFRGDESSPYVLHMHMTVPESHPLNTKNELSKGKKEKGKKGKRETFSDAMFWQPITLFERSQADQSHACLALSPLSLHRARRRCRSALARTGRHRSHPRPITLPLLPMPSRGTPAPPPIRPSLLDLHLQCPRSYVRRRSPARADPNARNIPPTSTYGQVIEHLNNSSHNEISRHTHDPYVNRCATSVRPPGRWRGWWVGRSPIFQSSSSSNFQILLLSIPEHNSIAVCMYPNDVLPDENS
ncbi:hypothetical protein BJ912DRAFT_1151519 [Pholiota molesta]|nr:hypothetical protein BJ912DRAFT_1151519 [Pholiota molesta]